MGLCQRNAMFAVMSRNNRENSDRNKKKTEGKRHKEVEWLFCVSCNKSVRREDYNLYEWINISFHEHYCSWDTGVSGMICKECYPRVKDRLKALLPNLFDKE